MSDDPARGRWFAISGVRLVAMIGAVFGIIVVARAAAWEMRALGIAIVLAALYLLATVPAALIRRWRSPDA